MVHPRALVAFSILMMAVVCDSSKVVVSFTKGSKDHVMENYRPSSSRFEPAIYRISIQGILDKNRRDYYGGMMIEHTNNPHHGSMTILIGRLADQSALIGVLNWLFDLGCPILSVEYVEAG
jgi:hypothetical protein